MIRLCIFDLDGTLINTLEDLADSTNHALQKHGFPLRSLDDYRAFVSDGLPKLVERALGEHYDPHLGQLLITDFNDYYQVHFKDKSTVYPGIQQMLQELLALGVKIAVVSNKPAHLLRLVVDEMFPAGTFAAIQGKEDAFPLKPDPASVLHVLDQLAAKPDETLYIGDSGADMMTACNAHIKSVGVSWGFRDVERLRAAGADWIASEPEDIITLVKGNDRFDG